MGLEVVTFISDLVAANPVGATDPKSAGDNHIRNIKAAILATFAAITGAVTASHTELNLMTGATGLTGTGNTVRSASPTFTGTLTAATVAATTVTGAGSGLTALNASNLASGTVPDARFPATLPAASAANLTAIPAANITGSHTLPDGVLSTNVPLLNAANVFTADQNRLFTGGAAAKGIISITENGVFHSDFVCVSNSFSGAYVTNGPTAAQTVINSTGGSSIVLATSSTAALVIDSSQNFNFKSGTVTTTGSSTSEVGYQGVPKVVVGTARSITNADNGKLLYPSAAAHVTLPTGINDGFVCIVVNNSGGSINLVQGTSAGVYLAGTAFASPGTRALAAGGMAAVVQFGSANYIVSGAGVT